MVGMGYNLEEIQESLAKMKYDEITATYLLLGRKASEVQTAVTTLSKSTSTNPYCQISRERSGLIHYVTPVSQIRVCIENIFQIRFPPVLYRSDCRLRF